MTTTFIFLVCIFLLPRVSDSALMASKLPLKIVSILPTDDDGNNIKNDQQSYSATLRGRDAITVAFSRPIMALGSDYDIVDVPEDKIPFYLYKLVGEAKQEKIFTLPGSKMRYPTTFIARYDTAIDWPTDLDLVLKVNPSLRSYDGLQVVDVDHNNKASDDESTIPSSSTSVVRYYKTPSQVMFLGGISSKQAYELSDGRWTSGSENEVPPDGIVTLNFSYDVDAVLISKSLIMRQTTKNENEKGDEDDDGTHKEITLTVYPCQNAPFTLGDEDEMEQSTLLTTLEENEMLTRCVQVYPRERLQTNTQYQLILPAGSVYNNVAGSLRSDLTVSVQGLRPFRFNWLSDKYALTNVQYQRWDLALLHGLQDGITADQLSSVITISSTAATQKEQNGSTTLQQNISFNASLVDKGTLRLHLDHSLSEQTEYTITVESSIDIKDGFGLELQSSGTSLTTSKIQDFVHDMQQDIVLETKPQNAAWSFLVHNGGDSSKGTKTGFDIQNVASEQLGDILTTQPFTGKKKQVFSKEQTQHDEDELPVHRADVDITSNFFLRDMSGYWRSYFTVITDLYVATVRDTQSTTAWVLRYSDGSPVIGAECTFYGRKGEQYGNSVEKTDEDGKCSNTDDKSTYLYVTYKDGSEEEEVAFTELPYLPSTSPYRFQSVLLTDRAVYKPGEKVYFKGYARYSEAKDTSWFVPKLDHKEKMEASVMMNGKQQTLYADVVADEVYGSFHGTMEIPKDVELRPTTLYFKGFSNGGTDGDEQKYYHENVMAGIIIADPRRPTATMEFNVKSKVCVPGKLLPLFVEVKTGTGTPIESAQVVIEWTHRRYPSSSKQIRRWWRSSWPMEPITKKGVVTMTTGAGGTAEFQMDVKAELENLSNDQEDNIEEMRVGDTLVFEAQWVGPTGELVTQVSQEVQVTLSEWSVHVETSVPNPIPGFNFGVKVGVKDQDGLDVKDVPAVVTLETFHANSGEEKEEGATIGEVVKCEATADGMKAVQCHDKLNLPTTEKYTLRVSVIDPDGVTVTSSNDVGQTAEEWERNPLREFAVTLFSDKTEYAPGDDISLSFENPFFANARLLLTWGNEVSGYQHKTVHTIERGEVVQNLSLDGIEGGCTVHAFLFVPRQSNLSMPVDIPLSKSWDFEAPRSIRLSQRLEMVGGDGTIDVKIVTAGRSATASPGGELDVVVTITDPNSGTPLSEGEAEVTIVAVDEAFLYLTPNPLPKLNDTFRVNVPSLLSYHDASDYLVTTSGYASAVDAGYRRCAADPWVCSSLWLSVCCDSDESDKEYLGRYSTWLTEATFGNSMEYSDLEMADEAMPEMASMRTKSAPMMMDYEEDDAEESTVDTAAARSGDMGKISANTAQPVLRTNFEVTPLFEGKVAIGDEGVATVNLKLPDTIGTYSIRAYAVDKHHRFGSAETKLVAKKVVNLQPMLPRIARVHDTLSTGVTVELDETCLSNGNGVNVTIIAESQNNAVVVNETRTLSFDSTGPHRVKFDMRVQAIGDGVVEFHVIAENCGKDAVKGTFSVYPVQDEVIVATSMPIGGTLAGNDGGDFVWEEDIEFPDSSPGSGELKITAGVGRLPALEAFASTLDEYKYAGDYLSALGLLAAMTPYKGESDTAGASSMLLGSKFGDFEDGLSGLTSDSGLGLEWSRNTCSGRYCIKHTDPWLNAHALLIAKRLKDVRGQQLDDDLTDKWANALTNELQKRATQARSDGHVFVEWDLLARSYLALGPAVIKDRDLSIAKLVANRNRMSQTGRLLLAHYLVKNPKEVTGDVTPDAIVRNVLESCHNSIRVQGRTAYISYGNGGQNAVAMEAQGLALSLFMTDLQTFGDDLLVEKLANWVSLGNARGGGSYRFFGYVDMVIGAFALADYDMAKSATDPQLLLKVDSGGLNVLTANLESASNPTVTATKRWDELPTSVSGEAKPEGLLFSGTGEGEASVAVELRFVPSRLSKDPVYRGIFVDKIVQVVDSRTGQATGEPLQVVPYGSTVEITVQMTTADDLHSVTLVDFVPAGLEPIDKNLSENDERRVDDGRRWYYNPFSSPETRPEKVKWNPVGSLPAGTHSACYRAVAVTQGVFALSPAKAFSNDQPELMGLSWAGTLVVTEEQIPETEEVMNALLESKGVKQNSRLTMGKDCPEDCGLGEECNISIGKCEAPQVMVSLFRSVSGDKLDKIGEPHNIVTGRKMSAPLVALTVGALSLAFVIIRIKYTTKGSKNSDMKDVEETNSLIELT